MDPSEGRFITMDEYQGSIFDPVSLHKYLYANANPVMYTDPTGYFSLSEAMGSTVVRSVVSNIARGASQAFVDTLIDTAIDLMLGEELSAKNFWRNYLLNFAFSFGRGPGNPYKPGNLADNFNQQNLRYANKVPGPFGKGNKGKEKVNATAHNNKSRNKPKEHGSPNSTEVVRDKNNNITKYTTYDQNGKIAKEVRITGKPHGEISRPNVKEPIYNTNPKTGERFHNGYSVRPANPSEIPKNIP